MSDIIRDYLEIVKNYLNQTIIIDNISVCFSDYFCLPRVTLQGEYNERSANFENCIDKNGLFLLEGGGGIGKTALMQYWFIKLANMYNPSSVAKQVIPFFVKYDELVYLVGECDCIETLINKIVYRQVEIKNIIKEIKKNNNKIIIFIDNVSKLCCSSDIQIYHKFVNLISSALTKKIVITSRCFNEDVKMKRIIIQPLCSDEIKEISNCFNQKEFGEVIVQNKFMSDYCKQPFVLLQLLKTKRQNTITNKDLLVNKIYAESIYEAVKKTVNNTNELKKIIGFFEYLCYEIVSLNTRNPFSEFELYELIEKYVSTLEKEPSISFVTIIFECGIINKLITGNYELSHDTLIEYFAAKYVSNKNMVLNSIIPIIKIYDKFFFFLLGEVQNPISTISKLICKENETSEYYYHIRVISSYSNLGNKDKYRDFFISLIEKVLLYKIESGNLKEIDIPDELLFTSINNLIQKNDIFKIFEFFFKDVIRVLNKKDINKFEWVSLKRTIKKYIYSIINYDLEGIIIPPKVNTEYYMFRHSERYYSNKRIKSAFENTMSKFGILLESKKGNEIVEMIKAMISKCEMELNTLYFKVIIIGDNESFTRFSEFIKNNKIGYLWVKDWNLIGNDKFLHNFNCYLKYCVFSNLNIEVRSKVQILYPMLKLNYFTKIDISGSLNDCWNYIMQTGVYKGRKLYYLFKENWHLLSGDAYEEFTLLKNNHQKWDRQEEESKKLFLLSSNPPKLSEYEKIVNYFETDLDYKLNAKLEFKRLIKDKSIVNRFEKVYENSILNPEIFKCYRDFYLFQKVNIIDERSFNNIMYYDKMYLSDTLIYCDKKLKCSKSYVNSFDYSFSNLEFNSNFLNEWFMIDDNYLKIKDNTNFYYYKLDILIKILNWIRHENKILPLLSYIIENYSRYIYDNIEGYERLIKTLSDYSNETLPKLEDVCNYSFRQNIENNSRYLIKDEQSDKKIHNDEYNLLSSKDRKKIKEGLKILETSISFNVNGNLLNFIYNKHRNNFVIFHNKNEIFAWFIPYLKENLLNNHKKILNSFFKISKNDYDLFNFISTSLDAIKKLGSNHIAYPHTRDLIKPYTNDMTSFRRSIGKEISKMLDVCSTKNRNKLYHEFFGGTFNSELKYHINVYDILKL